MSVCVCVFWFSFQVVFFGLAEYRYWLDLEWKIYDNNDDRFINNQWLETKAKPKPNQSQTKFSNITPTLAR